MLKIFALFRKNVFVPTVKKCYSTAFKPFYNNFFQYSNNVAVIDFLGSHKYKDVLYTSYLIAKRIETFIPNSSETAERICFLCSNESTYVSVLLACWISGNIAVPLCSNHPDSLLEYFIKNSQSSVVISSDLFSDSVEKIASKLNINHFKVSSLIKGSFDDSATFQSSKFFSWDSNYSERKALIIYTSGSTGLPKGVVLSHGNLYAQISSLVKAWEITSQDAILHTLPLHHMHGIMNALLCLLNVGGTVVMQPNFKASEMAPHAQSLVKDHTLGYCNFARSSVNSLISCVLCGYVWNYLVNENQVYPKVNLFYGVPTMYAKLIDVLKNVSSDKNHIRKSCEENIRLMTSGSAALPEPVFHKWKDITGHSLLERFGMSEIGMALSNPLKGPRVPGSVGKPLPGVEVKIVEDICNESSVIIQGNDSHIEVVANSKGKQGELLIRGPTVFKEYWNNRKSSAEAFTNCGWFKTGDTSTYDGTFKILGRSSVDIIKSGGYKISALQVESCLLLHPDVNDCAVFGVPDETWGEKVTALLVTKDQKKIPDPELKMWCKKLLPTYSVPSTIKYIDTIPRNIMGKVNKKELKNLFLKTTNISFL